MTLYDLKFVLAIPLEQEFSDNAKIEDVYAKIGKNFNAAFIKTVFYSHLSVYMYSVERDKVSIVIAKLAEENLTEICKLIRKKVEEVLGSTVSLEYGNPPNERRATI